MAQSRRLVASRFFAKYQAERSIYLLASEQAKDLIREILVNSPALIHAVTARCKESASVKLKLSDKKYARPEDEFTDIIAARVITYYRDHVPIISRALRESLEIDASKSVDKKLKLEIDDKFGYTSVHLIARTKGSWATSPKYSALRGKWFEIQVRSILEHSWAEIEHEVVYKSGIDYTSHFKRRFARLAGAIEILEDEFAALRDYQITLISLYKEQYLNKQYLDKEIDSVRLLALLECERPSSLGWRKASEIGTPFPAHIENTCIIDPA